MVRRTAALSGAAGTGVALLADLLLYGGELVTSIVATLVANIDVLVTLFAVLGVRVAPFVDALPEQLFHQLMIGAGLAYAAVLVYRLAKAWARRRGDSGA